MVYDSNYRFHDPVRYFTANDPYYWEIDNIPLKQLMENDLWLKDQLEAGLKITIDEIDRSAFSELKPYALGVDNEVKVKPGRYTARINDPMVDFRLQEIVRSRGGTWFRNDLDLDSREEIGGLSQGHAWKLATWAVSSIEDNLNKLTSVISDDALFLNGLYERAFAYDTWNSYFPPEIVDSANSAYSQGRGATGGWNDTTPSQMNIPLVDALFMQKNPQLLGSSFQLPDGYIQMQTNYDVRGNLMASKTIEHHFIKFWRGVVRTAVVDVPEELSIEIPPFNINDFNYVDENGVAQQRPEAEVRIDLLFIYSKPVDAPYVKIRSGNNPTISRTINQPQLGLVKGAGVLLRKDIGGYGTDIGGIAADSGSRILASVADSLNTSGGFQREQVYGSFPAPDDLMNLTPLLSEQLESESHLLIGQSILPIAYVVVRNPNTVTVDHIVAVEDVIDIRPFFRTTELSYNERAGIAAAQPPLSFSNPVVTREQLRESDLRTREYVDVKIRSVSSTPQEVSSTPRIIHTGLVLGGSVHGPEAIFKTVFGNPDEATLREDLVTRLGYPQSLINYQGSLETPAWLLAPWSASEPNRGSYATDWIEYNKMIRGTGIRYTTAGIEDAWGDTGYSEACFASCRAIVDLSQTVFTNPYYLQGSPLYVKAHLFNCQLATGAGNVLTLTPIVTSLDPLSQNLTIEVMWLPLVANDQQGKDLGDLSARSANRTGVRYYAGTMVNHANYKAWGDNIIVGRAALPSVMYEIIQYPGDYQIPLQIN